MARPQPIIIPGPTGMGGSSKKTTAPDLLGLLQGLSQLANLYQGTIGASKQKDTDALAVKNALRVAGLSDSMEAPTPAGPAMEMPSGGVVNAPTPGGERLDLEALGRSSMGPDIAQKAIMAKFSNMFAPSQKQEWKTAAPGSIAFNESDPRNSQVKIGEAPEKAEKEFNMPSEVDTFLGKTQHLHGQDMTTQDGRTKAWKWFGTKEGMDVYNKDLEQRQAINRPRFVEYTDPDNPTEIRMVNVNDPVDRGMAEAKKWIPGRPAKMSAATMEDIASTKDLQNIMGEIKTLYFANNKQGKKWVGMIDSPLGWLSGKTNVGASESEQKFRTLVNSLMNITGKLRAGSAWTEPEIKRLEEELATTSQGDTKFEQSLGWAEQAALNKMKNIESTAKSTRTFYKPDEKIKGAHGDY